jgi:hypothetical protein
VATGRRRRAAIFFTWLKRDTPPSTSAVDICAPLASLRIVSSICTASSRVGARISARAVFGRRLEPSAMILERIGSAKAAVLPEPVCATPRMSRPSSWAGNRLLLDRLGIGEAGSMGRLQQLAGDAEFGETIQFRSVFIRQFVLLSAASRRKTLAAGRNLPSESVL